MGDGTLIVLVYPYDNMVAGQMPLFTIATVTTTIVQLPHIMMVNSALNNWQCQPIVCNITTTIKKYVNVFSLL